MVDPEDPDLATRLVDLVDDPVRAAPRRPESFELPVESMPNSIWSLEQRPCEELDHGGCRLLGQSRECALDRGGDDEPPGLLGHVDRR
jgi:hypothetical protein